MRYLLFFAVMIILYANGCNDELLVAVPDGAYEYTSFDSLGTIIGRGWLKFEIKDKTHFEGEWQIKKIGDPEGMGPQFGEGKLVGSVDQGRVMIGLNPDWADNNIFLTGDLEGRKYSGSWNYSTFFGLTNKGKFLAIKK